MYKMAFPWGFPWFIDLFLAGKGTPDKTLVPLPALEVACVSFCLSSVSRAGRDLSCLVLPSSPAPLLLSFKARFTREGAGVQRGEVTSKAFGGLG